MTGGAIPTRQQPDGTLINVVEPTGRSDIAHSGNSSNNESHPDPTNTSTNQASVPSFNERSFQK